MSEIRVSEVVHDEDVFEVLFHGAMRHAFQEFMDSRPWAMVIQTPGPLRRPADPAYHQFMVVPSKEALEVSQELGIKPSELDL